MRNHIIGTDIPASSSNGFQNSAHQGTDAIDQRELARMAFSTLIDGLKHERRVRRHILLTTELVPRASFVPLAMMN